MEKKGPLFFYIDSGKLETTLTPTLKKWTYLELQKFKMSRALKLKKRLALLLY